MENRVWNQESGRRVKTKQNTDTYPTGGAIGDRSTNLVKLIGADNVSRRNFEYAGTYYITDIVTGKQIGRASCRERV